MTVNITDAVHTILKLMKLLLKSWGMTTIQFTSSDTHPALMFSWETVKVSPKIEKEIGSENIYSVNATRIYDYLLEQYTNCA